MAKRERWILPKTFVEQPVVDGAQQRASGEPIFYTLVKHANDDALSADSFDICCGCGLTHHQTYNVFCTKAGKWHLGVRAFRVPNTGPK